MTAFPSSDTSSTHSRRLGLIGTVRRGILLSIAASVSWISLVLLYVAFWAHGFTLFQSIVVVVVSLLVLGASLVGAWLSFGMRFADEWLS